MDTASFAKLFAPVAVLAALAAAGTAGATAERAATVTLTGPHRIVQGDAVHFTARVRPYNARCTLTMYYRTGKQRVGTAAARGGEVLFEFLVAKRAAPGRARAVVTCGGVGRASLGVMVIGNVVPPTITVLKRGFSIKPTLSGADTSWGVIVKNESPNRDALDVTILANYVMPDNRLIGSMSVPASRIGAGKEFATGGDLWFPTVPPVARLEVVVQVHRGAPADRRRPAIANVRVLGDRWDPSIVGSVEGEVVNDNAASFLQTSELSTVVMDAAGNILGGGRSYESTSLPPGSRQFFKIIGMRAVPLGQATTALVSVAPYYRTSG